MINRYNFLSTLSHLNTVTLTSHNFCGCDFILSIGNFRLNKYCWIESLHGLFMADYFAWRSTSKYYAKFTSQFFVFKIGRKNLLWTWCIWQYNRNDTIFDVRCKFMFHFVSHLKNLQHLRIAGYGLCRIYKLLEFVPNSNIRFITSTLFS